MAAKPGSRWSGEVTKHSDALDLKNDIFISEIGQSGCNCKVAELTAPNSGGQLPELAIVAARRIGGKLSTRSMVMALASELIGST